MDKGHCTLLALAAALGLAGSAQATITVPSYGATAWETFSYTFLEDFDGVVSIGVSNVGDEDLDANLLLDQLENWGAVGNTGFEMGDLSGYTLSGNGMATDLESSDAGNDYVPMEGTWMASLWSNGANTSAWVGTNGAYLSFEVSKSAGDSVSLYWAFLAHDYTPFADFAFLSLSNDLTGTTEVIRLAEIAPIPEPETYALILAGLGLVGWMSRRRKTA